ncbi:hypothetical protein HELRODRAFT_105994 [Helobdella robusta]|uniref:VWFA domain-containing protein n=1 Tax=Helobdella robusta TaxID=6412 RepID=T1EDZ1_HELRO|nr:hypothetical protein HELRODRAFT_105994 [Helobdella robusta]ESO06103.1 hypothetical protein HELRODRAFT_105994 [Helobdella robusta]
MLKIFSKFILAINIVICFTSCSIAGPQPSKCVSRNAEILFLIDSSSSVVENDPPGNNGNSWSYVKSFLSEVIQLLPIDKGETKVGVITFSTKVNTNNNTVLFSKTKSVLNVIANLPYSGGNTNTSGALRYARSVLLNVTTLQGTVPSSTSSSYDVKKVIVLITDGLSNVDSSLTLQEARLNKQLSIEQYAIGITKYMNEDELQDLVSDPVSYHYLNASDFSHLNLLINELLQRLTCSQPPLPEPCRDTRSDIAFVLDSSGSIIIQHSDNSRDLSNWVLVKNFVINVAKNLNIGLSQTRISLITFSHIARVEFYLKDFNDFESLAANISKIDIIGSETNTSGALRLMNDVVFNVKNGDRPDVPNVAIVMTDGQSNVNQSETIPEAIRAKNFGIINFKIIFLRI